MSAHQTVNKSVVTDQPGRPVAASCAIEGCCYSQFENRLYVEEIGDARIKVGGETFVPLSCMRVHELQLRQVLAKAKKFIEYARYELEPGEMTFGDQFPRQGCADKMMSEIDEVLK